MKKVLFLTGTRADFGKLKSLIQKLEDSHLFDVSLFVTGMHMLSRYGMTAREVAKNNFSSVYKYINQNLNDSMDIILSKTVHGLSDYVKEIEPDLIVIHGDRVEALAGAIVGALNNILVAHIEGGEVSGTIDELIRHSVTKLSHIHFVSNEGAKNRLIQLGETPASIYIIGSPDLDIMSSSNLPSITKVRERYDIPFSTYSVFMYHPVTTEIEKLSENISNSVDALLESDENYVVVYPNNDNGSEMIINELKRLESNKRFRIFPSIRFEYFLTLLKNADMMIGNSSAGVREMPFYGKASVNIGSRQNNRSSAKSIINASESKKDVLECIRLAKTKKCDMEMEFGEGNSNELFFKVLKKPEFWGTSKQKIFIDLKL